MGTLADFYIGIGKNAIWCGSVANDGYPQGLPDTILKAKTKEKFLVAVKEELGNRDDGTLPKMGWPWPWDDSSITDYVYAFDTQKNKVRIFSNHKRGMFPNMSHRKKVAVGSRSGVMLLRM